MGWATTYIADLRAGRTVSFRPRGGSMRPRIESGALCTVEPLADATMLEPGTIVLCSVGGAQYLHLIGAVRGDQYQIRNNHGRINGWVGRHAIAGVCVRVEP